ncbi:MAG: patatin-like phospholipase family protein [Filifactoraceae bacterium]
MKRGLVLGGGGSKGGYQIGAWKALRELNYEFDIVTGTSIGALNGALIVQGDFDRTLELWNKAETIDVLGYHSADNIESIEGLFGTYKNLTLELLKNKGLGFEALTSVIDEYFDKEKFRKSPIDYALMTVKVPSMEAAPFYKRDIEDGKEADYFCASAACFPAMKMKEIGGNLYIDGGYRDNLPVSLAVKAGATQIVAIDLAAPRVVRKLNFPDIEIKHIRCRWDLGNFIVVDQNISRRNINLGYLDTMKAFKVYEGEFYAFKKDNLEKKIRSLKVESKLLWACRNINKLNENDSLAFKLSMTSIKKRLEIEWASNLEGDRFVIALAETLGKTFKISPEVAYDFDEFNKLLVREFVKLDKSYERIKFKKSINIEKVMKYKIITLKKNGLRSTLEDKVSKYKVRLDSFNIGEQIGRVGSLNVNISNWDKINLKQRLKVYEMVQFIKTVPQTRMVEEFSLVGILHAYDFFVGAYMESILKHYDI